jgi:hypothetical protein
LELILNLAWLGICLCLVIVFGPSLRNPAAGRARGAAALAMVCVLCLLFPVISMSDDLQDNPALLEGIKLNKLIGAGPAVMALLPLLALQAPPESAVWTATSSETLNFRQRLFTTDLSRRPPPSILSAPLFV